MRFSKNVQKNDVLLLVVLLSFAVGFYGGRRAEQILSGEVVACELCDPNSLPSQVEVQEVLNRRGANPPLKVDGFIGKKSRKEWNKETFNDYAKEAMKGAGDYEEGTE